MVPPVIIMMTPRSGSSMVARIFHEHGLWVGETDSKPGYPSYENAQIKDAVNAVTSGGREGPACLRQLPSWCPKWRLKEKIDEIVPPNTPWMFKTGIDSWRIWDGLYEGTKFVFVWRDADSIVASTVAKRSGTESHARPIIENRLEFMEGVAESLGIPMVDSDAVVKGDYSTLDAALNHCGITMNAETVARCVIPRMWHH